MMVSNWNVPHALIIDYSNLCVLSIGTRPSHCSTLDNSGLLIGPYMYTLE